MNLFNNFFKAKTSDKQQDLTTISRTQIIDGFTIPAIIRNGQYFFIDLEIYKDGLVNCWEMVDLPLFKGKLNEKWVVTSIPDREHISIFSLGQWTIDNGEWYYNKDTFYDYVCSLVKQLNPKLENLHNCNGRTSEEIDGANVAIFNMVNPEPYYISKANKIFPERTSGEKFHIFFRNDDEKLYLSELTIYKNGHVEITNLPQKETFEFSELKNLIERQRIISNIPIDERVYILGLGSFIPINGEGVDITDKYNEFLDRYSSLTGGEDSIDKCRRILGEYKQNPILKLKNDLKEAYEAIPEHQKLFVGDMDTKDIEVRMIIYGKQEIENWTHYLVARERGDELPTINIPKPTDDEK